MASRAKIEIMSNLVKPDRQKYTRVGQFFDAQGASMADRLEQLQQKWEPVLRPELRENNGVEHVGEPESAGPALVRFHR